MEPDEQSIETADKRLQRGARTRKLVVRHAVDVASVDGLDGLSLGRLASDVNLSKSGVQGAFGSKQNLQLSVIEEARRIFAEAVLDPAADVPSGVERLRFLVERWIIYVSTPLLPGGCFWAANLAAFDDRSGPVHDALVFDAEQWQATIISQLRAAIAKGEVAELNCEAAALQLDGALILTNSYYRMNRPEKARLIYEVLDQILASPSVSVG